MYLYHYFKKKVGPLFGFSDLLVEESYCNFEYISKR